MTGDELRARLDAVEIVREAEPYYDWLGLDVAIAAAFETIEEWDYRADAHGYCHDRPLLFMLLGEIARLRAEAESHAEALIEAYEGKRP